MDLQIAGHLDLAQRLYRAILDADPAHAAANHCMGMLQVQSQRAAAALPHLLAALESRPQEPAYWLGYLEGLLAAGRLEDAASTLALGRRHGLAGEAVDEFGLRLAARDPAAGATLPARDAEDSGGRRGVPDAENQEARRLEREAVARIASQDLVTALELATQLTERHPERGTGWKILGVLLEARGPSPAGLEAMQAAVRLLPDDAEAHCNLGMTLVKKGLFDAAERMLRRALAIDPDFVASYSHLGNLMLDQGRIAEAEDVFRRAYLLSYDDMTRYTTLLFLLSHDPALDADTLFDAHRQVGMKIQPPGSGPAWPDARIADPQRRLRVGIVSGDWFNHAVSYFVEPLFATLAVDSGLELFGYYNNTVEDEFTTRIRACFVHWRPVSALSDEQLARRVREDGIDILIDLSGHTGLNRLGAFARKPAPIQASWLGYPGTTGLPAMDYYLADPHFLPPSRFDRHFVEKLVHLPAAWTFRPHPSAPALAPLPALTAGFMTFASFNRLAKVNLPTIGLWARLLLAVPHSILVIAGVPPSSRLDELLEHFRSQGIARERLALSPRGTMDEYLMLHNEVDICLDASPYTGGTTTNHALWMGVPTLTLIGETPASRQCAANLGHLGLDGFIAVDPDDFVAKGMHWSTHPEELADLRAGMRERWLRSPLRDPAMIADAVSRAFREMWRRRSAGVPPGPFEISMRTMLN